ncbi:hypothetical protein P280DRAFT_524910 [Massarina eburnea CBS 473.64]|uniref:Mid2 domain-containing protein n=1 Tax=Massarina eburnea CBS 473.64 TaxID=1395130 RepID=A0A6A6SGY5_9PLEO|nr:hypothetical protein P280DRAFT_524910 [Massarina eburnea CBS 473.64]
MNLLHLFLGALLLVLASSNDVLTTPGIANAPQFKSTKSEGGEMIAKLSSIANPILPSTANTTALSTTIPASTPPGPATTKSPNTNSSAIAAAAALPISAPKSNGSSKLTPKQASSGSNTSTQDPHSYPDTKSTNLAIIGVVLILISFSVAAHLGIKRYREYRRERRYAERGVLLEDESDEAQQPAIPLQTLPRARTYASLAPARPIRAIRVDETPVVGEGMWWSPLVEEDEEEDDEADEFRQYV